MSFAPMRSPTVTVLRRKVCGCVVAALANDELARQMVATTGRRYRKVRLPVREARTVICTHAENRPRRCSSPFCRSASPALEGSPYCAECHARVLALAELLRDASPAEARVAGCRHRPPAHQPAYPNEGTTPHE